MRKQGLFITVLLLIGLVNHFAVGQTLDLQEIIAIEKLDSVSLDKFCTEKGFKLKEKKEDQWVISHSYFSPMDESIWFIHTYPKDTTKHRYVYYYFDDIKTNNAFRKQIKEQGFSFKQKIEKEVRGFQMARNIYLSTDYRVDLGSEKHMGKSTKYALIYYKQPNY